jgi:hypothetical protein
MQETYLRSIWGRRESERICSHWSGRCYKLATDSSRASNSWFTFFLLTELEEFNPLTALGSGHLSGDNKPPAMILMRTHFKSWFLFCCRQLARYPGIFCNPVSMQGPHDRLDRCDSASFLGFLLDSNRFVVGGYSDWGMLESLVECSTTPKILQKLPEILHSRTVAASVH